jgi:hypothetical protein
MTAGFVIGLRVRYVVKKLKLCSWIALGIAIDSMNSSVSILHRQGHRNSTSQPIQGTFTTPERISIGRQ